MVLRFRACLAYLLKGACVKRMRRFLVGGGYMYRDFDMPIPISMYGYRYGQIEMRGSDSFPDAVVWRGSTQLDEAVF